jgi:asparagine synthase (glutamine-hydrolysing)
MNGHARIYEVLDQQAITPMIEQHLSGEQNRRLLIWSLLNVDAWLNENL